MKLIHLSDIHVWRYTWDVRRLLGLRLFGMFELLLGRAAKFPLERMESVVDRVQSLGFDHLIITGDVTTTALPSEFSLVRQLLAPLLVDPRRVSMVPGNHDRTTRRSMSTRRFEATFGDCMPAPAFPWIRWIGEGTVLLGLDATRPHFMPYGRMPDAQLMEADRLLKSLVPRPETLIIACHYPVAAPLAFQNELRAKRIRRAEAFRSWLATIGPHVYCCGHVHAAWAFIPPELPQQLCLNAGSPLMRDETGLRLPGFLEIDLDDRIVNVRHHAWDGSKWVVAPMLQDFRLNEQTTPG